VQQSVPFFHVKVRFPSCESPPRNRRSEVHSCSVQELVREGKRSRTRARPMKVLPNLLLYFMCEKWIALMASFQKSGWKVEGEA